MYSFKDRLIDWVERRGTWARILLAAGIALIITAIILAAAMPGRGVVNANKADISTVIDALTTKASHTELDSWGQDITQALSTQAVDIIGLRARLEAAEDELEDARDDITAIQGSLAELSNSPPEAYLTGTFKNYILHVKSSEVGNFTANVYLVYPAPICVGNTTAYSETVSTFYGGINFTESTPAYVPVATFNGTDWGISKAWWNVGIFPLEATTSTLLNITCVGLNSTWEPSFAYVEVFKANG